MSDKDRIVVTGLGIVSCFGSDIDNYYQKLLSGTSGARLITEFECEDYPTRIAAPISDFTTEGYLDKKQARRADPCINYAVVAGKKALEFAGLSPDEAKEKLDVTRCGILMGSGMGGMKAYTDGVLDIFQKGFKRLTPFFVPFIITNMPGAMLAIELGFQGPNYSVSTACATSAHAIYLAAKHIRDGEADMMICGGAEASINETCLAGFVACKALSRRNAEPTKASRPWDKDRDGFLLGEGAGALVLETLEHAKKRGAKIYAEYLGGAVTCDANHMTSPVLDGSIIARTLNLAMKDAKVSKEQVNYINAHATSTLAGDMCEVRAFQKAFGDHMKNLKVNATKSMIGHALGAAGVLESVATIKAIETGQLHPTINLDNPDEELVDIDPIAGKSQECDVNVAIANSYGFGGHNASLVFGKYQD